MRAEYWRWYSCLVEHHTLSLHWKRKLNHSIVECHNNWCALLQFFFTIVMLILQNIHYNDVIMGTMATQITSLTNVYSNVYSGADHRKHQRSASLAFERRIHRWPVNSPHRWPVTWKMFPVDDVIMLAFIYHFSQRWGGSESWNPSSGEVDSWLS